ncbi:MAG: ribosome maturation factor RimP [Coriobacteriales bacterium]|nr:ribosome maturation factor RimP [Coriobacteriales bacterium]
METDSRASLRDELLDALEAAAVTHGVDIVDVEVVGAQKNPTVRVRIDHAEAGDQPITLDEVSAQTGWISDLLDELDPIDGQFTLEVSSPGMSRPLRKTADFERFAGSDVSLTLVGDSGRLRYTGRLVGLVDGQVSLVTDEGEFAWPLDNIKTCKIRPDFSNEGAPKSRRSAKKQRG